MTLAIASITFDCVNAPALAEFWAHLLERKVDPDGNQYFATVGRSTGMSPILMFIAVPDKNPGKNVVHLDLTTADLPAQIDRAISLGAEHIGDFAEFGIRWTTLADPEGNLFDIGAA